MSTHQATLDGEVVEFETRNHGGLCDLCDQLVEGPLHEHLPECPAREDVFDGDHPSNGGASA